MGEKDMWSHNGILRRKAFTLTDHFVSSAEQLKRVCMQELTSKQNSLSAVGRRHPPWADLSSFVPFPVTNLGCLGSMIHIIVWINDPYRKMIRSQVFIFVLLWRKVCLSSQVKNVIALQGKVASKNKHISRWLITSSWSLFFAAHFPTILECAPLVICKSTGKRAEGYGIYHFGGLWTFVSSLDHARKMIFRNSFLLHNTLELTDVVLEKISGLVVCYMVAWRDRENMNHLFSNFGGKYQKRKKLWMDIYGMSYMHDRDTMKCHDILNKQFIIPMKSEKALWPLAELKLLAFKEELQMLLLARKTGVSICSSDWELLGKGKRQEKKGCRRSQG